MSNETSVETPVVTKPAKATKKAKPAKAAKPSKNGRGPTIRERVFKLLATKPMTGPEIMEKLALSGVPSLLKDEGVCSKPRITREKHEDSRAVYYKLTALGRKDHAAGKVNENAAPASGGNSW